MNLTIRPQQWASQTGNQTSTLLRNVHATGMSIPTDHPDQASQPNQPVRPSHRRPGLGDGSATVEESSGPSVVANNISLVVSPRKGDSLTILDHIDFQAWPGQVTGIVGPSGSGKSSLLYCLAGLEEVTEGSVSLLGKEITHMRVASLTRFRRRHLGFVFQSYNLISSMTVEENLALPFTLRGSLLPRKKADDLLRYFGLAEQKKQSVTLLSGGEQQRVALARVLLSDADIVFADEPTGALDRESGDKVITILADLARRSGKTVILVTHSEEVADHCDRIIEVRDGRLGRAIGEGAA